MVTIMELVNFFDHNSREYNDFVQNLIYSNGDIPFDVEEVNKVQNVIISTINNYLNRSQSRYSGLFILDKVLPQCSKDILSKYCMHWMSKATQFLESVHTTPQELSIACKVLGCLIMRSKDIADIQKQISMHNVKQLINILSNLPPEKNTSSMYYLIAVLLHQYAEVCERFQISLKKLILLQVDSSQENLVIAGARCYALLAKAIARSFKPPTSNPNYTSWTYTQVLICNNLHAIMDELFSGLIELENVNIGDKLELTNISEENVIQFYFNQKKRFLNLCCYLSYMLCGFDKKNSAFPHVILKVLCRGLAIQPANLKKQNSVREQMLYLILPKLHTALFSVLEALINGFKEQLVPFGSTILQLLLQTLQWTENVLKDQITLSGDKPFKSVRISAYNCINAWLMNIGALSGIETVADEYLPSILKDVIPEKERVLLTIQKTHNLSKRALKRLRDSQYEKGTYLDNGIAPNKEHYLDVDVCRIALNVLQNIFFSNGILLKQTFFKTVRNIIIPVLYDCYLSSSDKKFYKENPSCRLLLLRVLRSLQMNPHTLVSLPTQYSLEIFEMALNDKNLHIIQEAQIALSELEKIMHPCAPPIQLTQIETIQKEFVTDTQHLKGHTEIMEVQTSFEEENVVHQDIEQSPNKRLKVTNSHNTTIESITKNVVKNELHNGQTNEDNAGKGVNRIEEKITIIAEAEIVEDEQVTRTCEKSSIHESSPAPTVKDAFKIAESTLPSGATEESEDVWVKNVFITNETDSPDISDMSKVGEMRLSPEKQEEREILQLFQDIPKNDN